MSEEIFFDENEKKARKEESNVWADNIQKETKKEKMRWREWMI